MNIDDLKYVLALNEHKNFSDAADACCISQSAFSKRIQNIETEINGILLFDRSKRPIELTLAGKEFVRYAKQITINYENLQKAMLKFNKLERNTLRIGAIPVIGRLGVLDILHEFHRDNMNYCNMQLFDRPTQEIIAMLKRNEIDVGIIAASINYTDDEHLSFYSLQKNTMVVVTNILHPLASEQSIDLNSLKDETLIITDRATGMHDFILSETTRYGVNISNVITCRNIDTMVSMISLNQGIGLMSDRLAQSFFEYKNIKIISLDIPIDYDIYLVINNDRTTKSIVQSFLDFSLDYKFPKERNR